MIDAALDFPFVEQLPKREQSRWAKSWSLFESAKAATAEHGFLMPVALAAKLLGVGKQRVHDIVADGRLVRVELDGHVFITSNSVVAFLKVERKNGRPLKVPLTVSESWKFAKQFVDGK
jgi:hypothetical protein